MSPNPVPYREKIIDAATGEETWRDYTPAEIAEVQAHQEAAAAAAARAAEVAAARAAIFGRLGLTPEESELLLS